jgi:hypothetical protein
MNDRPVTAEELGRAFGGLAEQLHEVRLWVADLRVAMAEAAATRRADVAALWDAVAELSRRLHRLEGGQAMTRRGALALALALLTAALAVAEQLGR